MAEYFYFVDVDSKKVYDLGSKTSAKYELPYVARMTAGNTVCFFGDETQGYLEEKYESGTIEEDFGKEWGPKYLSCSVIVDESCREWLDSIDLSLEKFYEVLYQLGGTERSDFFEKLQTYINKDE